MNRIPKEIIEASNLDGCSTWREFWSVVFPMTFGTFATFFLMSTGMGVGPFIAKQIEKGVIAGVIVPNPKADYEAKAPSDPAKAFAIRFVLVKKDNLAANKQFFE
jgi:ABC-type spermidine/putrescine transport system permease subunit I